MFIRVQLLIRTVTLSISHPRDFQGRNAGVGLPFPSQVDLPEPRIELTSLASTALGGILFTTSSTWEAHYAFY